MSVRTHLCRLLLAGLCAFAAVGASAASEKVDAGLSAPYALDASGLVIMQALHRFAADHGLTLSVDAAAKRDWRTAKLDGWVRADSGRAFLEQLARAHRFSWFAAGRTLHIGASNDSAVERIALGGVRADSARAALEAVGIYDVRFGWGELAGQDAVLVSGPRAYRALVRRFLANQGAPASNGAAEPEPMIFPLRFAQASDTPASSASSPTRPGVATLLRELLIREPEPVRPPFSLPAQSEPAPPLPALTPGLSPWGGPAMSSPAAALWAQRPVAARPPALSQFTPIGIAADSGTNSVIVWGDRSLRPHVQTLVDALDRPAPLVSMDILVIESDVNTVLALSAASERAHTELATNDASAFDDRIAQAMAEHRVRLLNRQTLVGRTNAHTTLAIGAEASHARATPDKAKSESVNGRAGAAGDRLDLAARIVPAEQAGTTAIAVDIDLLMAQPTGLPGETWANTSSVKFDTAVTLVSGAPPRLIASYPVATARAEQRAIFISAKAL
jgi:hypothetical protein